MSGTVKTLLIVAAAAVLLFLFRVSVCTIYTIPDNTLAPAVKQGDRVLVNRWSYGLRVGGNDWISYCRIARKTVEKGDFIAFDAPVSSAAKRAVMMGRVVAVPGDTVKIDGQMYVIPRGCQVCTCGCMSSCIVNPNQHGGIILHTSHIGAAKGCALVKMTDGVSQNLRTLSFLTKCVHQ